MFWCFKFLPTLVLRPLPLRKDSVPSPATAIMKTPPKHLRVHILSSKKCQKAHKIQEISNFNLLGLAPLIFFPASYWSWLTFQTRFANSVQLLYLELLLISHSGSKAESYFSTWTVFLLFWLNNISQIYI